MSSISALEFSKYSGAGNDFIVVDSRTPLSHLEQSSVIRRLCDRHHGIGADGLLLIDGGGDHPYRMRIFNADGGEAEMCGNGLRCAAKFLSDQRWGAPPYSIEVSGATYVADLQGERIVHSFPPPTQFEWGIKLGNLTLDWIDTGVPHALLFVDELESIDTATLGREIRYHPHFGPKGTNANFVAINENGTIRVRTYERGVEGETLACGTGATAAVLASARRLGRTSGPIDVEVRSGETLTIDFQWHGVTPEALTLKGPASHIFSGRVEDAVIKSVNLGLLDETR